MAEYKDTLGLDASQYKAELDKLGTSFDAYNRRVDLTLQVIQKLAKQFDLKKAAIERVDSAGNKFATTLKSVGGYVKILNSDLHLNKISFQEATNAVYKNIEAIERQKGAIRSLVQEERKALAQREGMSVRKGRGFGPEAASSANQASMLPMISDLQLAQQKRNADRMVDINRQAHLKQISDASEALNRRAIIEARAIDRLQRIDTNLRQTQAQATAEYRQHQANRNRATETYVANQINAHRKLEQSIKRTTRSITLDWQSMFRILQVQQLHLLIGNFTRALSEGVETAKEFSIRIAEIQTISSQASLNTQQWEEATRRLSDRFGDPILGTARGLYEAISNQVGEGAEAVRFMDEAMRFSLTTVSSTADAVDLLSSVINAYNMNTRDAAYISSVLFSTIDLGRVRASDMASTLGRVAPLAANVGIGFEELSAAIATITIQGIKPAEALTAINGAVRKLYHPTEEMKKLLHSWGVESGKAAIATFGFAGTLRKMMEAAESGEANMAKLFNEIRATRFLSAVSRSMDRYEETLDRVKNSTEQYNQAQELTMENVGRQFEIQINKIRNFFTMDFGRGFIKMIMDATNAIWDDGLSGAVKSAISGLTNLGAVFVAYTVWSRGAAIANRLYAVSLSDVSTAQKINALNFEKLTRLRVATIAGTQAEIVAYQNYARQLQTVTARQVALARTFATLKAAFMSFAPFLAITGIVFAYQKIAGMQSEIGRKFKEDSDSRMERVEAATKVEVEQYSKRARAFEEGLTKQFQAYNAYISSINRASNAFNERQKVVMGQLSEKVGEAFESQIEALKAFVSSLNKSIADTTSNIEKADAAAKRIKTELARGNFDASLKLLPEDEQVTRIIGRITEMQYRAITLLTAPVRDSATLTENLEEGIKVFENAQKQALELMERRTVAEKKLADAQKERAELEAKIQTKAANVDTSEEIAALKVLEAEERKATQRRDNRRVAEIKKERQRLEEEKKLRTREAADDRDSARLAELTKEIEAHQRVLNILPEITEAQKQLTAATKTYTDALEAAKRANEEIAEAAKEQVKIEERRIKVLQDIYSQIVSFKVPDSAEIKTEDQAKKIIEEFNALIAKAREEGGLKELRDIEAVEQKRLELIRQVDAQLARERLNLLNEQMNQQAEGLKRLRASLGDSETSIAQDLVKASKQMEESFGALVQASESYSVELPKEAKKQIDSVRNLITTFRSNPTRESLIELNQAIIKLGEQFAEAQSAINPWGRGSKTPDFVFGDVKGSRIISDLAIGARQFFESSQAQLNWAKDLEDFNTKTAEFDKLAEHVKGATEKEIEAKKSVAEQTLAYVENLKTLRTEVEVLAQRFRDLSSGAPAQQRAQGGPIWRTGGLWQSRGTDTVPAMLTPGEFVVNAQAAKQWSHLLKSINNGTFYAESGGFVPQVVSTSQASPVSNISSTIQIGDINIQGVPISGNIAVDAHSLGRRLKRELRRGLISNG